MYSMCRVCWEGKDSPCSRHVYLQHCDITTSLEAGGQKCEVETWKIQHTYAEHELFSEVGHIVYLVVELLEQYLLSGLLVTNWYGRRQNILVIPILLLWNTNSSSLTSKISY